MAYQTMLIREIPDKMSLTEQDDLGLVHGCRGCGERPAFLLSPDRCRSVTVPCCHRAECFVKVAKQAEAMAAEAKAKLRRKARLKWRQWSQIHWLGRFLRCLKLQHLCHRKADLAWMKRDPIGYFTTQDSLRFD